ncbi:MAG: VanZ family protein [Candidatus Saccharibacteria bacterium]
MSKAKRTAVVSILFILFVTAIGFIGYFSSQTGLESHSFSRPLAGSLGGCIDKYINRNSPGEIMWLVNLEAIVRKLAHLLEYTVLGVIACSLLNVLTQRVWLAAFTALLTSPIIAFLDELNQKFSYARTPSWFDVKIDTTGALIGVILVTAFFLIFTKIEKLKCRIAELENLMVYQQNPPHDGKLP